MNYLYRDLNFYEFTSAEFEYYALIWAADQESAMKFYEEDVCERDKDCKWGTPAKIDFVDGVEKILKSIGESNEDKDADIFYTLKCLFTRECPQVVLISSDLI